VGATVGSVVEVHTPRGVRQITVISLG
jgi:hypothetical protein